MKPYERRAAQAYPYFKLARWDADSLTWRDGKKTFPNEQAARESAIDFLPAWDNQGLFRVSVVEGDGSRRDLEPFYLG